MLYRNEASWFESLLADLGQAYGMAGPKVEGWQFLDSLRAVSKNRYVSPYFWSLDPIASLLT